MQMQKIVPFLWFDNQAEEAMRFYVSIFPGSKVLSVSAMVVSFELAGQALMALNGGPHYTFTEAISLYVNCENQAEVDDLWAKLTEGGEPGRCGWLKDRYGLSWQIIPTVMGEMLGDPDPEKSSRVMQAMLQMDKIDIAALERAYQGG